MNSLALLLLVTALTTPATFTGPGLPMAPHIGKEYQPGLVFGWDPSAQATGYLLYYGASSRNYTNSLPAGTNCLLKVPYNLLPPQVFAAVTATNAFGQESDFSAELVTAAFPTNRVITITAEASGNGITWLAFTNLPPLVLTNPPSAQYFRLKIAETNF